MIALAWIIFAAVVVGVLLFCFSIVRYYQDRSDSEALPTFITVLGLSLTLFCVFLIPIDIYSVSSTQDHDGKIILTPEDIERRGDAVRIVYYILYASILAFAFGLIPFAYFYYEEDDENITVGQKIWAGCKYTIFLLIIVIILFSVGLVLYTVKPGNKPTTNTNVENWVKNLIHQENMLESGISFAIACLTTVGYLSWISYTAYGLSAFPIGIIRGKKHITEDVSDLQNGLENTRGKRQEIKSKYLGGKRISKRDEEQLNLLQRKEKVLLRQGQRLSASQSGCGRFLMCLKPFFLLFGIVFALISVVIFLSILLTTVDKAVNAHHLCGAQCGFVIAYRKIFNPVDSLMTILAKFFPLDYVLIAGIIIYIFFATLSGIIKIGVRFLWIPLFKIRRGATPPQGLLLASIILMLSILALNMEITTLAPVYATWGSQVYFDSTTNTTKTCSMDAPQGACHMTQIGTFVNRISMRTAFFGVIYFYATWVFLLFFLIGIVIAGCKAKSSNIEQRESDSDEDER